MTIPDTILLIVGVVAASFVAAIFVAHYVRRIGIMVKDSRCQNQSKPDHDDKEE